MSVESFSRSIRINRPAGEVYDWHLRGGVLERLTPPWETIEIVRHDGVREGARVEVRMKAGAFWTSWEVEHYDVKESRHFRDRQLRGPFKRWEHLHRIEPDGASACVLTDAIEYEAPAGFVTNSWIRGKLERLFTYRHAITKADTELRARYGAVRSMRFLIAGASGLLGAALIPFLHSQGHEVVRLVRRTPRGGDEIYWNPETGELDPMKLRGVDAVINLSGENLADGRWTPARREAILASRVAATRTLVTCIEKMKHRPFVLVSMSGAGIYGARGEEHVDEDSMRGTGFLAGVCKAWENETAKAEALGMRAVAMRAGAVLTPKGGALAKLLPLFRAGLGGRLGHGEQAFAWISIDDMIGAIYHAVLDQRCGGAGRQRPALGDREPCGLIPFADDV